MGGATEQLNFNFNFNLFKFIESHEASGYHIG